MVIWRAKARSASRRGLPMQPFMPLRRYMSTCFPFAQRPTRKAAREGTDLPIREVGREGADVDGSVGLPHGLDGGRVLLSRFARPDGLAHATADLEAGHAGHGDVEEDGVKLGPAQPLERFGSGSGELDLCGVDEVGKLADEDLAQDTLPREGQSGCMRGRGRGEGDGRG